MKTEFKNIDCSTVVTVHAEGRLLHRTLRALDKCMDYAKRQRGYNSEIVLVLDKVNDSVTTEVIGEWKARVGKQLSLFEVNHGSLSLSRNFGIAKSKGKYVSILDGDDLYSETWIAKSVAALESNRFDIAHPHTVVGFPLDPFFKELKVECDSRWKIFEKNLWPALMMVPKAIFKSIPYIKDEGQYAYQDWLWNCETIQKGYRHGCVDKTLMAIRQKAPGKSLWQRSFNSNKVVRPNGLFKELMMNQDAPFQPNIHEQIHTKSYLNALLEYINYKSPELYEFIKSTKRRWIKSDKNKMDDWIKSELETLSMVDPEINFTDTFREIHEDAKVPLLMLDIEGLRRILDEGVEEILLVGNEKDLLRYPHTTDPDKAVAIITDKVGSRLVPTDFNNVLLSKLKINTDRLIYLILRILMESQIRRIVLSNSALGNELFLKYHQVIKVEQACACISALNRNIRNRNDIMLLNDFDIFDKIFVESHAVGETISKIYGIPDKKIVVHSSGG